MSDDELASALTSKTILAYGERMVLGMSIDQAAESRDALAKAIYGKIFNYIIDKINVTILKDQKSFNIFSIGILDIFGFENFQNNSFEQLCINYANENLQQFFVRHIFKVRDLFLRERHRFRETKWSKLID